MTLRVLVVGCGRMGAAHARAYAAIPGVEIAGLVARRPGPREALAAELGGPPTFDDVEEALLAMRPDAVCVATYPDTHERFCLAALRAGAHVFVEKPLAEDLLAAARIVAAAREAGKALVVGYILRHHATWIRFVELARTLGRPLVVRITQNQPSHGEHWARHLQLMQTASPIVDCAVHYVDVMAQMTGARATHVHAVGARLTDALPPGMYNYGHLQLRFDDGSLGWYEAGWGPMMSDEAVLVKDVVGPAGSVTLTQRAGADGGVSTVFLRHRSALDGQGAFVQADEALPVEPEPTFAELCRRQQEAFVRAIREGADLRAHHEAALASLRIVLAADRSIREGVVVALQGE
jgi:predicted dehydrogenase